MLRKVVGKVVSAGFPVYNELALPDAIAEPVEAHVHCLTAFLLYFVIHYACCTLIVALYRRCQLLVCSRRLDTGSKVALPYEKEGNKRYVHVGCLRDHLQQSLRFRGS